MKDLLWFLPLVTFIGLACWSDEEIRWTVFYLIGIALILVGLVGTVACTIIGIDKLIT